MINKIAKILIVLIISGILLGYNDKLFPSREEITDLAVVNVLGIDIENNKPRLSVIIEKMTQSSSSDSESEGESNISSAPQELLTATGKTLKQITRNFQTYTDKTIIRRSCKIFFNRRRYSENQFWRKYRFFGYRWTIKI